MAGNKFAAMLHRNAICWIEIVLIYTFLEWILIGLLFLNAFFCYLISMYVSYFGLKSSCPLCSRLDLILHNRRSPTSNPFIDLVCDKHVSEIAQLRAEESELKRSKSAQTSGEGTKNEEEEEEVEEEEEDRDCRGVATADDTRHLYKTGSCKRVHGSNSLYKIMKDDIERMNVVRSQMRDGKVQMSRDELFQFFTHVENVEDPRGSGGGGGVAFRVEIADRTSYPPTAESDVVGNFLVSTPAAAKSMHDEEEWMIDDGCSNSSMPKKISHLEEEKAVMQMDASHYRRMMEEQTRHSKKEKLNLSKELEDCRNQILVLQNKLDGQKGSGQN